MIKIFEFDEIKSLMQIDVISAAIMMLVGSVMMYFGIKLLNKDNSTVEEQLKPYGAFTKHNPFYHKFQLLFIGILLDFAGLIILLLKLTNH